MKSPFSLLIAAGLLGACGGGDARETAGTERRVLPATRTARVTMASLARRTYALWCLLRRVTPVSEVVPTSTAGPPECPVWPGLSERRNVLHTAWSALQAETAATPPLAWRQNRASSVVPRSASEIMTATPAAAPSSALGLRPCAVRRIYVVRNPGRVRNPHFGQHTS
jgi:hypothetical protein